MLSDTLSNGGGDAPARRPNRPLVEIEIYFQLVYTRRWGRFRPEKEPAALAVKSVPSRGADGKQRLMNELKNRAVPSGGPSAAPAETLDALPHGVRARVLAVGGDGAIARRLMEMGFVPGAPVCVIKAAPLGDPIEVRVRGYHLAMRRVEARTVSVVAIED